jgi:peroxiredoxin
MTKEFIRQSVAKNNLTFDILSDSGNQVASRFGLTFQMAEDLRKVYISRFNIDLPKYNGDDSWTLPMPARFIASGAGVVHTAEVNPDYTIRPEPSEILEVLETMRSR